MLAFFVIAMLVKERVDFEEYDTVQSLPKKVFL